MKLSDIKTEDGVPLDAETVYWYAYTTGGIIASVAPIPIQRAHWSYGDHCVFFSGVGLGGSVQTPIIAGRASRVFATQAAMEEMVGKLESTQ